MKNLSNFVIILAIMSLVSSCDSGDFIPSKHKPKIINYHTYGIVVAKSCSSVEAHTSANLINEYKLTLNVEDIRNNITHSVNQNQFEKYKIGDSIDCIIVEK